MVGVRGPLFLVIFFGLLATAFSSPASAHRCRILGQTHEQIINRWIQGTPSHLRLNSISDFIRNHPDRDLGMITMAVAVILYQGEIYRIAFDPDHSHFQAHSAMGKEGWLIANPRLSVIFIERGFIAIHGDTYRSMRARTENLDQEIIQEIKVGLGQKIWSENTSVLAQLKNSPPKYE